jgi:uncharacterized protein
MRSGKLWGCNKKKPYLGQDLGSGSIMEVLSYFFRLLPRRMAHYGLRAYQLSVSALIGRQCRHFPTCSAYCDEAIQRHGLWIGTWMSFARLIRCGPFGTHGIDLVPEALPKQARWYKPWLYGRWRGVQEPFHDEG